MIENTQVTGLLANDDETVTLLTASGSEFNAKKLIVTAGAWTNKILQSTGLTLPLTVRSLLLILLSCVCTYTGKES